MVNWHFLAVSLAFLMAVRQPALRPGGWREGLSRLWFEGVELYFQSALLFGIYMYLGTHPQVEIQTFHPLFFFLGAGLFHLIRPKDEFFFLAVFAACAFHASPAASPRITDPFFSLAEMVAVMIVFQALFLGIRRRLLLSSVPAQLEGLPIDLFTAAFLAFAVWAFQGILP